MKDKKIWERSKRAQYTRLLLNQKTIQDCLGVLKFIYDHYRSHLRFVNDSLVLRTHVEGLLRHARIRDSGLTLRDIEQVFEYVKLNPEITDEIREHWASEEMYRKLKEEDLSKLPLYTEFKSLPKVY